MKKILVVLSEWGYWGVELTGPMAKLERAGYELVFASPKGGRPIALPPSYDEKFWDVRLAMYVNSKSDVDQVKSIRDSPKLDNPINISAWMPERPYFSAPDYPRKRDAYAATVQERREEMSEFAGLLLVGGSGPIIDVANNQRVHDIILAFYGLQKPIAAICYGVAALVLLWTLAIAFPSCAENT